MIQNRSNEDILSADDEDPIGDPALETPTLKEELLDTLQKIPPDAFERLCQRLLRESGSLK